MGINVVISEDCGHHVVENQFTVLRLPRFSDDGSRALNPDGTPGHSYVRLQKHALPPSNFDSTGLVPAPCPHGLKRHPDPAINASLERYAVSWMRGRYVAIMGYDNQKGSLRYACPVCRGEPRPDDLTNGFEDPVEA